MAQSRSPRLDVYTRITDKIITALEQGVRPWMKPWNADHAAGRITKPLRHNGTPYSGINIIMLWQAATACDYSAPIWSLLMFEAFLRKLDGRARQAA